MKELMDADGFMLFFFSVLCQSMIEKLNILFFDISSFSNIQWKRSREKIPLGFVGRFFLSIRKSI
jgi:hypothetical protein